MNDRIDPLQLDTCISRGEAPIYRSLMGVAFGFPRQSFTSQKIPIRDMITQTLSTENTEFNLSHVEPTAMLGSIVKLQPVQYTSGLGWLKGFIQGCRFMGVQVVFNQDASLGIREMLMNQLIYARSPIRFGVLFSDLTCRQFNSGAKNMNRLAVPSRRYS